MNVAKGRCALVMALGWTLAGMNALQAQQANAVKETPARRQSGAPAGVAATSNTSSVNDTRRAAGALETVQVTAHALGGGLMSVQDAPKAVSTISREAIDEAAPGTNFSQMIESIPGVYSASDDVTGMQDGSYNIRGFTSDEIGVTVNGVPLNDPGDYRAYATEYGDTANMGDITVSQGIPDIDQPDSGAAGGHIAWATLTPSHKPGLDYQQAFGSHDYHREFFRLNSGDTGPVRSWISYSNNESKLWRGAGRQKVEKFDGKSLWTINENNSISASFQYNRQFKNKYRNVSKQDVAQHGYFYSWDDSWSVKRPGDTDGNYYALHTNAFKTLVASLDGEFRLSENLRMSVVPYFTWNKGGVGTGGYFTERNDKFHNNEYRYYDGDLNQTGSAVNNQRATVYGFTGQTAYRPGIVLRFNQELGLDNSLEYGFWYERSRQQQWKGYTPVDFDSGQPYDKWAERRNLLEYPSGATQYDYLSYTNTEVAKGFVTDSWTPDDHWTVVAGTSYLYSERHGSSYNYPGATYGSRNYNYRPGTQDNLCNTPRKFTQCGSGDLNISNHKVLPTLGVKYALDERNQFYYGIGRTYRVPPARAVFGNEVVGRPPNQPETAWNNDLGYRYYGDKISLNLMLYQSQFHNKTLQGFDDASGQYYYFQVPKMRMRGFDAEASFELSKHFSLYSSYTYTQAKQLANMDAGDDGIFPSRGKTMPSTPKNLLYARLRYHQGPVFASLSAKYSSAIYGDFVNSEKAGGYTTLSAAAGFKLPNTEFLKRSSIQINVANLLNRHAFTYAVPNNYSMPSGDHVLDGREVHSTGYSTYSLLQPRAFVISFRTELM